MFTIEQIKKSHSEIVKTGADFPKFIQALIQLGVAGYDTYVRDGHTEYQGQDGYSIMSDARYETIDIAENADAAGLEHYLKAHQQGQSDYLSFCGQAADTGVEKWTIDTGALTCTYYDTKGNTVLVENIPA